ncbi:hypothetical protein [Nocardia sp. CDC160]|uniref:hypothetical protein n=1 Tax=Nocardia sp. CDC160 TaxID=3112166 RepID=UPI002DB6D3FD|nr:hypothetical protein [Nocardia sp. CDC160]MEC3917456.1 hypothetical protein [Nocardia sp. CDC160]
MSERDAVEPSAEALRAQLRMFCCLMLGSPDAADRVLRQIYRREPDHLSAQQNWPSERVRLCSIAAEICGVRR